jgi:hypothetical protein
MFLSACLAYLGPEHGNRSCETPVIFYFTTQHQIPEVDSDGGEIVSPYAPATLCSPEAIFLCF